MRRLLATAVLFASLTAAAVLGVGASEEGAGYEVRAIFDNVSAVVPGEDVKIGGATIGTIASMDVTRDKKAAVVLAIRDRRFTPFRADARCTVRPQSLIGEKFVECQPGTRGHEPLAEIRDGDAAGQHLLPLRNTSSPVDIDLANNIMRLPYRERFRILLSEFGTGLAGRGTDLNEVIHRANPALRETDEVLSILARQNRVLANLAESSDRALAPLAREKERVTGFIAGANRTAQATAERRGDLRASIRRLPGFLRELRPLMADLQGFSNQASPVVSDLGQAAPDVSRLIEQLGPFSQAARPSLRTLGRATVTGRPALVRSRSVVRDLRRFGRGARPVSTDLARLLASFDRTGGIERFADFLFFQMASINGFDSVGHYLRAGLILNLCSTYAIRPAAGCNANFNEGGVSGSSASDLGPRLASAPRPKKGGAESSVGATGPVLGGLLNGEDPKATAERERNLRHVREAAKRPKELGVEEPLLDYLLGGEQ